MASVRVRRKRRVDPGRAWAGHCRTAGREVRLLPGMEATWWCKDRAPGVPGEQGTGGEDREGRGCEKGVEGGKGGRGEGGSVNGAR